MSESRESAAPSSLGAGYGHPPQKGKDILRIQEIFGPTIQGEGAVVGRPTMFVRTGGCDYRCSWCDTMYAVDTQFKDTWPWMTPDEIVAKLQSLLRVGDVQNDAYLGTQTNGLWVTISGGNPMIQNLRILIAKLQMQGFRVCIETQGVPTQIIWDRKEVSEWIGDPEHVCLSPKPPSSGMSLKTDRALLRDLIYIRKEASAGTNLNGRIGVPPTAMKIVVMDEHDLNWAYTMYQSFRDVPFYLQVGNPTPGAPDAAVLLARFKWLVDTTMKRNWIGPILLPQVHTLLWGNERAR